MSSYVRRHIFRAFTVETLLYNLIGFSLFISSSLVFSGFSAHTIIGQHDRYQEIVDHNKRRLKNKEFAVQLKLIRL